MSRSWIVVCCMAIGLIGFIAYTDIQAAKAAAVQAEIQKQQLRIAQEEAERQRKAEAERQLQARSDEAFARYDMMARGLELQHLAAKEGLRSEQMRREQAYWEKQAGISR